MDEDRSQPSVEQLRLFDVQPLAPTQARVPEYQAPEDYPDPRGEGIDLTNDWSDNPLFSNDADTGLDVRAEVMAEHKIEFVPSYEVVSIQGGIYEPSVKHLVDNAFGLDEGEVTVVRGEVNGCTKLALFDGNHRLNAALRRGQMFYPAVIFDVPSSP